MSTRRKQNRLILIKKYALSAVNLYGVIQLDEFITVFNHYETENPLTKDEAFTVLEFLDSIDEVELSFRQGVLAKRDFKNTIILLQIQSNKPRYTPTREEFLKYEEDDYVEPMKPVLDLVKFITVNNLVKEYRLDEVQSDVLEIRGHIILGESPSKYMHYIRRRGYQFQDEMQLNLLIGLIELLHNNTRMYENNGFTPLELKKHFENKNIT